MKYLVILLLMIASCSPVQYPKKQKKDLVEQCSKAKIKGTMKMSRNWVDNVAEFVITAAIIMYSIRRAEKDL